MNTTKWNEIFNSFYYGVECSNDKNLSDLKIKWTTKTVDGFIYSDYTWSHFGYENENYKDIDYLKIDINEETYEIVIDILRRIHVPGEIFDDCVYVYGHRKDVDYI